MDVVRLSVGAALLVGALVTAGTVWMMWPSGPSSREMLALHQASTVEGWVDESSVERLHERWSMHLNERMLPVTADHALMGGAVVHTDPLWLHMKWTQESAEVSIFLSPVTHHRQPMWSCSPAQRTFEVCQRTHEGWHVVMIRPASNSPG